MPDEASRTDDGLPDARQVPTPLLAMYRALMRVTRKHGMGTLSRTHARVFRRGQYVKLPTGAQLYIPRDPHFIGFLIGIHEPHITERLRRYVQRGSLCLDAGANIGYFSSMMAHLAGPSGQVVSFEPVPENFALLQINARLARATGGNITAINAAVSDAPGTLQIVRHEFSTQHQVGVAGGGASPADSVRCTTIDEELAPIRPAQAVEIAKVDVEGHELPVLRGMTQSIASGRVRRLIVEITPGPDLAALDQILSRRKCRIECWVDGAWHERPVASLQERTDIFIDFSGS